MKHRFVMSVIVVMISAVVGCDDRQAKRLPDAGFQVEFQSHNIASEMTSGKTVAADITVKNISPVTWPSKPDNKDRYVVNLSYHWLSRKGERVIFDGVRTSFPRDLKPGESVALKVAILPPAKPGRYILEVTLVQESAAWFPDKNGAKLALPVNVTTGGDVAAESITDTQLSKKSERTKTQSADGGRSLVKNDAGIQTTAKPSTTTVSTAGGPWSVQLGAYAEKKVAANIAKKLQNNGYDAYVTVTNVKGKELHRVRVGHLEQQAEAEKLRDSLRMTEKLEHVVVTNR